MSKMNPIIGTIVLFSAIFFLFFGVPIIMLGVTSWFAPPEHMTTTIVLPPSIYTGYISIKKIIHKGKIIWVDA